MKKVITILCVCLLLTGCGTSESSGETEEVKNENMFVTIQSSWNYKIVYHRDTKVMYAVSRGDYNQGNFTVLVNPDGSPMLYEGEVKEDDT